MHATKIYGDFFWLQNFTGTHAQATKYFGGFFNFRFRGLLHIFYYKTLRGHSTGLHGGRRLRILGGFCPSFGLPDCTGYHVDDGCFFPHRKPIIFNIIMHLLHSCIHCDWDHSCSILHKSRDCFRPILPDYQNVRGHISRLQVSLLSTRLHGGTNLIMVAFFPV